MTLEGLQWLQPNVELGGLPRTVWEYPWHKQLHSTKCCLFLFLFLFFFTSHILYLPYPCPQKKKLKFWLGIEFTILQTMFFLQFYLKANVRFRLHLPHMSQYDSLQLILFPQIQWVCSVLLMLHLHLPCLLSSPQIKFLSTSHKDYYAVNPYTASVSLRSK